MPYLHNWAESDTFEEPTSCADRRGTQERLKKARKKAVSCAGAAGVTRGTVTMQLEGASDTWEGFIEEVSSSALKRFEIFPLICPKMFSECLCPHWTIEK